MIPGILIYETDIQKYLKWKMRLIFLCPAEQKEEEEKKEKGKEEGKKREEKREDYKPK